MCRFRAYRMIICRFPIMFKLLPKRGNPNCRERINIMERFIRLFGRDSIKCLVADREVHRQGIVQVAQRKCHSVPYPYPRQLLGRRSQNRQKDTDAAYLCQSQTRRGTHHAPHLSGLRRALLSGWHRHQGQDRKVGAAEPRILLPPEGSLPAYKERWTIETMFKGMKIQQVQY